MNLKCSTATILHKDITLKILAYNMMHLILKFLLILISDVYCQS